MKYSKKDLVIIVLVFFIGIFTRIPFREKMMSHWDAPQYTIGIIRFSLVNQTPGPPGYPLYIAMGRLFHIFIPDIYLSILAVSILFAGIGAATFYIVSRIFFNRVVGIIASIFFLSSGAIYYLGATANPYELSLVTSATLASLVFIIWTKKQNLGIVLGIILSIAIGIRPQDAFFLIPLGIYGYLGLQKKEKIFSLISFTIASLAWFLPMCFLVGGIGAYLNQILPFFKSGPKPDLTLTRLTFIAPIIIKGFYQTVGIAGTFMLILFIPIIKFFRQRNFLLRERKTVTVITFILWITPSLFFNIFVRSDHAAHQMAYLSAFIFLSSYGAWAILRKKQFFLWLVVVFLASFNLFTFFKDRDPKNMLPYVPQSYHNSELRKNDSRLKAITTLILKKYSPKTTLIESEPQLFRPLSYYLRNYMLFAYSILDSNDPTVANVVHFGYNWDYKSLPLKSRIITFPNNIQTIIVIPNNKTYTIQADNVRQLMLDDNALVYIFSVQSEQKFALSVHSIKKL